MPFSVVQEVLDKVWPFGDLMCDLWHSFDVLGTTSSILSLCVISIDRYYAITKPFDYAVKMTPKKAKLLIVLIFIVSSLLSFPAIFWWRAISIYKPYTCSFPVSTGYIIFSSTLSFYGPLCVMIVSYYRIYKAAVEQTRSLKTGAKTISYTSNIYHAGSGNNNLGHFDNGQFKSSSGDYIPDHTITLRMHRGGNYNDSIGSKINTNLKTENRKNLKQRKPFNLASSSTKNRSSTSLDRLASVFCNIRNEYTKQEENTNASGSKADLNSNNETKIGNECEEENRKKNSFESQVTGGNKNQVNNAWSISRKVSKLAKERKAAKTLGIVMGVFILMWLPFFITHIVMGICAQNCDINEDLVYSIVTWLGWLNSACNPLIYVCWSRDFRRAFKKVLCGFRESKQRSSTGYSSYYFSSKFNQAPGSLANKKRPLIGDRDLQNRHTNNKLTSIKQNNLTSSTNQQSKNRGINKFKNSKEISTIDELDDSLEISTSFQKSSDKNSPTNKPSESKSSPNLMSISNAIKPNDDDDDDDFKVINDNSINKPCFETKNEQSNLMSIEKQLSLNKVISKKEQLDIENNNQSNNLNNQQLSNDKDARKEINENNLYLKNENKLDKESDNRFSLGNWFSRGSKKDNKEDKKQTTTNYLKRKNSKQLENSIDKELNIYTKEIENRHVDKIISNNNEKFNKNNKKLKDKTNQANDNNLSSIDYNLKLSSGSCCSNKLIENINEIDNLKGQNTDHLIAHNQKENEDQLINNNDKNGRLTSPYYKITAECTKSNLDNKLKDNLNNDKNDVEEEFFIKIQLEPR